MQVLQENWLPSLCFHCIPNRLQSLLKLDVCWEGKKYKHELISPNEMLHIISAYKSTTMITRKDGNAVNRLGIDSFMNFILHKSKLC